jgi:chromosome segregation ATPase
MKGRSSSMLTLNRWKKNRTQSAQSGITTTSVTTRPTTAANSWTELPQDEPFQKAVEEAVYAALNSDAFRNVIASQVDPVIIALSRQQEKLNALKASSLNLESSFETALGAEGTKSHLEPVLTNHLKSVTKLIEGIPNNGGDIEKIQQTLKAMDERLSGIEEKMSSMDAEIVNADLRSAIRFGELSNELQDRNKMLGDRLWSVEGDLGKKMEGHHRRLVGMFEELGKSNRSVIHKVSSLDMDSSSSQSSKLDEMLSENSQMVERIESLRKGLSKLEESQKNIQTSEKGLARNIQEVRDIVSSLNTSSLDAQSRRLDDIERSITNVRKALEAHGNLASVDSKLLSTNTSRLTDIIAQVTKIEEIVEAVNEHVSNPDQAVVANSEKLDTLSTTAATMKETLEKVDQSVKAFNSTQFDTHRDKLNFITSMMTSISETMTNQGTSLDDISRKISGPLDTTGIETITAILQDIKSTSQHGVESHASLLASQTTKLDAISHDLSHFHSTEEATLKTITISLERLDNGAATQRDSINSHFEQLGATVAHDTKSDEIIHHLLAMKEFVDAEKSDNRRAQILEDLAVVRGNVDTIKDHTSSIPTVHDGILSVDTKIKSSEESVHNAIQNLHTTLGADMHNNKSFITSFHDLAVGLEDEMKSLSSRLASTTSDMQSVIKGIDFGTSLDALSRDVQSTYKTSLETAGNVAALPEAFTNIKSHVTSESVSVNSSLDSVSRFVASIDEAIKETGRGVQGNTEMLTNIKSSISTSTDDIRFLLDKQVPLLREDIKAIDLTELESAANKNQASVESIEKAVPEIIKIANDHASALGNLDYKMKHLIAGDIAKIGRAIEAVDQALSKAALETISAVEGNAAKLSNIRETILDTFTTLDILTRTNIPGISFHLESIKKFQRESDAQTMEILQANVSTAGSIRHAIEHMSNAINDNFTNIKNEVDSSTKLNLSSIQSLNSNVANLDTTINQTTTAVRVNAAALSRIDKDVLETGAQVKAVVLEGIKRLSKELDRALSQLDESCHDNGTRIRGISEFAFPKIENEMKGIQTNLERLLHSNVDGLEKTRDALEVIGSRIVGTSRKFDDLVDAVRAGDDVGDHISHSKALAGGNGKVPGEHRILAGKRSRAGSNGSSSKDGT